MEIKQIGDKNIYEFKVDETLEKRDIEKLLDFITKKRAVNENIKMIAEIGSLEAFSSVRNIAKTIVLKFKAVQVISAYALLSDTDWIEDVVPVGDFFTPGLQIKQFALNEHESAIKWLEQCSD